MFDSCRLHLRPSLPFRRALVVAIAPVLVSLGVARADDSSPAPILQYFESTYGTIENRMPDVFAAGYGSLYTPPPGRADSGNQSVGYDQFNRFDLGSAGDPTLYGTEDGLKAAVNAAHTAGLSYGIDFVMNHNGYSGTGTAAQNAAFEAAGGYPGFVETLQTTDPTAPGYNTLGYNAVDGDYHSAYATGDQDERLAGLIDIDHTTNWQFIRQPTTAGNPSNIPSAGSTNNPILASNAQYYTDTSGAAGAQTLYDPKTGQTTVRYNFNTTNPMAGTAVTENAMGLLMRNAQWLVQDIGIDMFRLDATKNMEPFVLNYFDDAVYQASNRTLLDGTKENVFSFGEYYDTNTTNLLSAVRKDINPNTPNTVGGDRDTLDFPLFFAMKANLTSNGYNNSWYNVVNASLDTADDGLMNGSVGVKFAASADDTGADLSNTSYAYMLMLPGNAIVYDNEQQFGTDRSFPNTGRADALGGAYGNQITNLVNIRDVYAQGNYEQRFLSKESYAFERSKQSITLLSNRSDNYVDQESFNTDFAAGTYLVELTGNAKTYGLPQVLQVQNNNTSGGYVNVSFLASNGGDHGYLVYGLQAPQGAVTLGGVSQVLKGNATPTLTGTADQQAYQNATTLLSDIDVVKGNSFNVTLNTTAVTLPNGVRDKNADGDNALLKLDGGLDVNGNGHVDYTTPNTTSYGFEQFTGTNSPGLYSTTGNGTYAQTIDTTGLSEGYHYVTVRAFRYRDDGGPAVYQDFKETIYVDRFKPVSAVDSFHPYSGAGNNDIWIRSTDETANSVHSYLNLPATTTDSQILAMVSAGQGANDQIDRDVFKTGFNAVPNGNNVVTVVTYEIDGNYNIQRFTGITNANTVGAGIGDLNHDGTIGSDDLAGTSYGFEAVLYSQNAQFNASADVNGDGVVDDKDLFALDTTLANASTAVKTTLRQVELRRGNINGDGYTNAADIDAEYKAVAKGTYSWTADLNSDGVVNKADVDTLVNKVFQTRYGDADLDGSVSINDFNILAANFGKAGTWATGDFDGDGVVSINDFNLLAANFGYGGPPVTAAQRAELKAFAAEISVPEPAILSLAATCVILLHSRRRGKVS